MKGVVFDMDGVLFDTETLVRDTFIPVVAEFGHTLTKEQYLNTVGRNLRDTDIYYRSLFGDEMDLVQARALCRDRIVAHMQEYGIPEKPGLRETLEGLKARGLKMAIASSSQGDTVAAYLQSAGITDYFSAIVSGEQIENGKPAPDIYLAACEKLGFEPADCFAVEDAPAGLQAAQEAGCCVVFIPDLLPAEGAYTKFADYTVRSLTDLLLLADKNKCI